MLFVCRATEETLSLSFSSLCSAVQLQLPTSVTFDTRLPFLQHFLMSFVYGLLLFVCISLDFLFVLQCVNFQLPTSVTFDAWLVFLQHFLLFIVICLH